MHRALTGLQGFPPDHCRQPWVSTATAQTPDLSAQRSQSTISTGDRTAAVDEILISGGSVLEGVSKLNASELEVKDVVVFLDQGGRHDTRAKGTPGA